MVSILLWLCVFSELDDSLWWPKDEEELPNQDLLQPKVPVLSHQEDVTAQLEEGIRIDDFVYQQSTGKLADIVANEAANHQNHWYIKPNDPGRREKNDHNPSL